MGSEMCIRDRHTLVHDSVMALLPELLRGLQAVPQAYLGHRRHQSHTMKALPPMGRVSGGLLVSTIPAIHYELVKVSLGYIVPKLNLLVMLERPVYHEGRVNEPENGTRQAPRET